MNKRAFKKRERRSMRKLIKLGVFQERDFTIADGEESIDAPTDLDDRHQHHGFIDWGVLRGVPVVWITSGYYEPETDCHLPSALLSQHKFENETDWAAIWERERPAIEGCHA